MIDLEYQMLPLVIFRPTLNMQHIKTCFLFLKARLHDPSANIVSK